MPCQNNLQLIRMNMLKHEIIEHNAITAAQWYITEINMHNWEGHNNETAHLFSLDCRYIYFYIMCFLPFYLCTYSRNSITLYIAIMLYLVVVGNINVTLSAEICAL